MWFCAIIAVMKKLLILFLLVTGHWSLTTSVHAVNPFFGNNQNQIMLNLGQGVNSFGLIPAPEMFVPFNLAQLTYSQPTTVFRIPARQNFNIMQTIGYGQKYEYTDYVETFTWNWADYSTQIASITWDVALLHNEHVYFGVGMGVAIQGQQNAREGTKFLLPFKVFLGWRFTENWNAEIFAQHFSNGDTGGVANYSYNFFGLGIGYSF